MDTLAAAFTRFIRVPPDQPLTEKQLAERVIYFYGAHAAVNAITDDEPPRILASKFDRIAQELIAAAMRAHRSEAVSAPGTLVEAFDQMTSYMGSVAPTGFERDIMLLLFYAGASDALELMEDDDRLRLVPERARAVIGEVNTFYKKNILKEVE